MENRKKIFLNALVGIGGILVLIDIYTDDSISNALEGEESQQKVSDYSGMVLTEAQNKAFSEGLTPRSHDASDGDAAQLVTDNWKVCFQNKVNEWTLDLGVVKQEAPCPPRDGAPIPWPKMPNVVGMQVKEASDRIHALEIEDIQIYGAYLDAHPPSDANEWITCFQEPSEGEQVDSDRAFYSATLDAVPPGVECPESKREEWLNPQPEIPQPDVRTSEPDKAKEDQPSSDEYDNCSEARADGITPLYVGQPGYSSSLDGDGDGVACES